MSVIAVKLPIPLTLTKRPDLECAWAIEIWMLKHALNHPGTAAGEQVC
jgi:hypothetical protein